MNHPNTDTEHYPITPTSSVDTWCAISKAQMDFITESAYINNPVIWNNGWILSWVPFFSDSV